MLHELLLALSGHPSPLFQTPSSADDDEATAVHALLSPSEAALLETTGKLAEHHRKLRGHAQWVAKKHKSTICRAVATIITRTYLARFQKKILDVESKILTKDATVVGAYDIVPLATVVGEFDDWHRLMGWLWRIACFMQPVHDSEASHESDRGCTGAALINKLRSEASTGFPEIESAATDLSRVAEIAWLRQLAPWLVHGKLSVHSANDFFIKSENVGQGDDVSFSRRKELLPCFVSPATASSILFIGKSLHQVRQHARQNHTLLPSSPAGNLDTSLAAAHLQHLVNLPLPISQGQLSRAVSAIRLSLSQNILQHLLPMQEIVQLLTCLRRYFLLGHGEFAVSLINEAESRLQVRQQNMGRLLQQDPVKAMQGLSIKDAELQQALNATWKSLARDDEDGEDSVLDFATRQLTLVTSAASDRPPSSDSISASSPPLSSIRFNDLLFPSSTILSLDVSPPLDLFISTRDAENYATINAYLLAIRRAQVRLSSLWRRTAARRDYPSSSRQPTPPSPISRQRLTARSKATRKVWASASAALFLISETAAYLEGEVIKESCDYFESWVRKPTSTDETDASLGSVASEGSVNVAQRDPETLSAAHQAFLASLVYALLLTDIQYTRELRSLLGNIDALIAYFGRLLDIQQKLDIEIEAGGESDYTAEEEQRISLELDRARKRVDSDMRSVVARLRQVDHERIGVARYLEVDGSGSGGFEPWRGGGVDRLLMKLEFGRMRDDDYDIV